MLTDIGIDITNIHSESAALQLFTDSLSFQLEDIELVIEHDLLGLCNFELTYKIHYSTDRSYVAWVDAHNLTIDTIQWGVSFKNAPTEDYGVQNMLDSPKDQNDSWLRSNDSHIRTYDLMGTVQSEHITTSNYQESMIPTSPLLNDWNAAMQTQGAFQVHWLVEQVRNAFNDNLGIAYNNIHVAADCSDVNASAVRSSSLSECHIAFGRMATAPFSTMAELDVIAHEMGHVFLYKYLNPKNLSSGSLHEGIADMLGTYIETILEGGEDWLIGDNIPLAIRNLEFPADDCFDDVKDNTSTHDRSVPLGHWFHLISTECVTMEDAIKIVIDALNAVPGDADYDDLMNSTLSVVKQIYGNCSPRMQCLAQRWEEICINRL